MLLLVIALFGVGNVKYKMRELNKSKLIYKYANSGVDAYNSQRIMAEKPLIIKIYSSEAAISFLDLS